MHFPWCNCACVFVALALGLVAAHGDSPPAASVPRAQVVQNIEQWHLREPIWSAEIIHRESVLPVQFKRDGSVTGRLAFPAEKIISLRSADGSRTLKAEKDFRLESDGLTLTFTPDSVPLAIHADDLFPPAASGKGYRHRVEHPDQNMLYNGEKHWFHDRQFEVTYRRSNLEWPGPKPTLVTNTLPKTLARLRAGEPITISVSGDSISQGYNASGYMDVPPNMPPYPDLVAAQLEAVRGSKVTLHNRAIAGWSIANGLEDLDNLLSDHPNLVIVAYGMNDVGRRDPAWFRGQVAQVLNRLSSADTGIEVILVSPMLGNAEWVHTPRDMFPKYRDVLASFVGPGVAIADLTAVWQVLLRSKHDLDLIGNGLNHPSDFGHRLYAETILALLVDAASTTSKP